MTQTRARKAGQRSSAGKSGGSAPGWVYMLMGLSIGLAVAYAVFVNSNKKSAAPEPEAVTAPAEAAAGKKAASEPEPVVAEEPVPEGEVTYDFYNVLPSIDVELYEDKEAPAQTATPAPVAAQGTYIIQAGSFSAYADANRRKAELGLLGVHSEILAGDANGRTVYRVYTDPLATPDEVNRTSTLLTNQGIDILLKRVDD